MLKIYFTASTSYNGEYKQKYREIINYIEQQRAEITSGKQIIDANLLSKDKKIPKKKIFQREKDSIDQSHCLIAEVTKPSLGVGGEIVYALTQNKKGLDLVF